LVRPVIQIKPVEGDALLAYRNYDELRADRPIEPIAVHAQVVRRITKTDESRQVPEYLSMNRLGNRAGHATRVGRHANVSNLQCPEKAGFLQRHL
jgi:hypothetical protein